MIYDGRRRPRPSHYRYGAADGDGLRRTSLLPSPLGGPAVLNDGGMVMGMVMGWAGLVFHSN